MKLFLQEYSGFDRFESFKDKIIVKKDGKIGVVSVFGTVIVPLGKYSYIADFNDEFVLVSDSSINGVGKCGVLDKNFNEVIPPIYISINYLFDELFIVTDSNGCTIVNYVNQPVLKNHYEKLKLIDDYLFEFTKNEKKGIIDINENIIVPPIYYSITKIKGANLICLYSSKTELSVCDYYGNIIIEKGNYDIHSINGKFLVKNTHLSYNSSKIGVDFLSIEGKLLKRFDYHTLLHNGEDSNSVLLCHPSTDKYLFVHEDMSEVPVKIKNLEHMSYLGKGLYAVRKNNIFGFRYEGVIDDSGKIIVPLKYDSVSLTRDGNIYTSLCGVLGLYTREGKQLLMTVYTQITNFFENKAFATYYGGYKCIDENGDTLFRKKCKRVVKNLRFTNGLATVEYDMNNKKYMTIVDEKGKDLLSGYNFRPSDVYRSDDFFIFEIEPETEDDICKVGVLDKECKLVIPPNYYSIRFDDGVFTCKKVLSTYYFSVGGKNLKNERVADLYKALVCQLDLLMNYAIDLIYRTKMNFEANKKCREIAEKFKNYGEALKKEFLDYKNIEDNETTS